MMLNFIKHTVLLRLFYVLFYICLLLLSCEKGDLASCVRIAIVSFLFGVLIWGVVNDYRKSDGCSMLKCFGNRAVFFK